MDDAELLTKAKRGDNHAAEELVVRYYPSVLRFLTSICHSSDDAEELTQETFVRAINSFRGFRGESGVRTWLHTIAYHEFARRLQTKKITARLTDEVPAPLFENFSTDAIDLERALQQLPLEQCTVFVLCDVQQLTMEEAATITGSPIGTVKSRLYTARRQLLQLLSEEPEVTHDA